MEEVIKNVAEHLGVDIDEAERIVAKAVAGGEASEDNLDEWFE